MDEARLVQVVAEAFQGAVARGALDLEDDAAVLPHAGEGASRVVTTDVFVEEIDFSTSLYPAERAGHRAILQNVSDVCAMGASPVGFVWSLAVPDRWLDDEARPFGAFCAGAAALARAAGMPLYGGDLSRTTGPFTASITAFGDVAGAPLRRRGARAGDGIFLGRRVGASAAGLARLLRARDGGELAARAAEASARAGGATGALHVDEVGFDAWVGALPGPERRAVRAHVDGRPQLALARALVGRATACMDVSDGLLLDLSRLLGASSVGADLDALDDAVDPAATREQALSGGEDFVLLFTLPEAVDLDALAVQAGERPVRIGRAVEGRGMRAAGLELSPSGWDHFRR